MILKRMKTTAAHLFRCTLTLISPMLNTRVVYWVKFGRRLDLRNPVTLNEKILWLKFHTYWNNETVRQCADKLRVREYVEQKGLGSLLNELIGVYTDADEIDFASLPEQFALKLNVGCGCNLIVSDKRTLDIEKTRKTLKKWLRSNHWMGWSEMQYKDVRHVILVEKYLESETHGAPADYKVYCFNGAPKYILVCVGREKDLHPKFYFFDEHWCLARINADSQAAPPDFRLEKPACFDRLLESARILSEPFPFVRADFYIIRDRVVFGELTFTPSGGMDSNRLPETDRMMGELLRLPDGS